MSVLILGEKPTIMNKRFVVILVACVAVFLGLAIFNKKMLPLLRAMSLFQPLSIPKVEVTAALHS